MYRILFIFILSQLNATEMRGKAQRDSPVFELLALPGEYISIIKQLPVRNIIPYPHRISWTSFWSAIYTLWLVSDYRTKN